MITLRERLQLELRNRDPREITELILDNSKANEIEGLDSSYINLRELSLVNVGLTTLKGFPSLPNLEKLDLSDNKISTGLENLTKCNKLSQLLLTNNRIKNIKDVECLANFYQLEILDLFNCAVSFEENYRKEIFGIVPTLKYLDGFDEKNEEELNESEEYEDEEEEIEICNESNLKDVYELSDGSESEDDDEDDEYETEEGEMLNSNRTSGKAPNTGGKDMNLYPNEVVEISDEDEVEENIDEYDEDEDYDEKVVDEIIETNGKSKVNNNCINESDNDEDDDDDDDDDEEDDEDEDDDNNNDIDDVTLNSDPISLVNGIDKTTDDGILLNSHKRKYDNVFNDCYDEDECCDIKSIRNNSDFELTDESSLLDKV